MQCMNDLADMSKGLCLVERLAPPLERKISRDDPRFARALTEEQLVAAGKTLLESSSGMEDFLKNKSTFQNTRFRDLT